MSKLSLYERPLHCTDIKRETLYIKNDYPLVIRYVVAALGDIKLCLSPSKPKNSYD